MRRAQVEGHWGAHYDGLHITSRRDHCGLPHYPLEPAGRGAPGGGTCGAAEFVDYLRRYAARFALDVRLGARVTAARRAPGGGWVVSTAGGNGSKGATLLARELVVASGRHARAARPPAVLRALAGFDGAVLHSSEARGLEALALRRVLVVGFGNSAADIAMALLERGAPGVTVAVRSVPPVVRRQWGPLAVEWVSRAGLQFLPPALADLAVDLFIAVNFGRRWWRAAPDLPDDAREWRAFASRRVPVIDKWAGQPGGGLVAAVQSRRIRLVGPPVAARPGAVVAAASAACGGRCTVPCDTVILATGSVSLISHSSRRFPRAPLFAVLALFSWPLSSSSPSSSTSSAMALTRARSRRRRRQVREHGAGVAAGALRPRRRGQGRGRGRAAPRGLQQRRRPPPAPGHQARRPRRRAAHRAVSARVEESGGGRRWGRGHAAAARWWNRGGFNAPACCVARACAVRGRVPGGAFGRPLPHA